jgi:hypothetical protein
LLSADRTDSVHTVPAGRPATATVRLSRCTAFRGKDAQWTLDARSGAAPADAAAPIKAMQMRVTSRFTVSSEAWPQRLQTRFRPHVAVADPSFEAFRSSVLFRIGR